MILVETQVPKTHRHERPGPAPTWASPVTRVSWPRFLASACVPTFAARASDETRPGNAGRAFGSLREHRPPSSSPARGSLGRREGGAEPGRGSAAATGTPVPSRHRHPRTVLKLADGRRCSSVGPGVGGDTRVPAASGRLRGPALHLTRGEPSPASGGVTGSHQVCGPGHAFSADR